MQPMAARQQRMRSWYADESATMAVREEARAEAWLSQVWARAEAQAEKEARECHCVKHIQSMVPKLEGQRGHSRTAHKDHKTATTRIIFVCHLRQPTICSWLSWRGSPVSEMGMLASC